MPIMKPNSPGPHHRLKAMDRSVHWRLRFAQSESSKTTTSTTGGSLTASLRPRIPSTSYQHIFPCDYIPTTYAVVHHPHQGKTETRVGRLLACGEKASNKKLEA